MVWVRVYSDVLAGLEVFGKWYLVAECFVQSNQAGVGNAVATDYFSINPNYRTVFFSTLLSSSSAARLVVTFIINSTVTVCPHNEFITSSDLDF